MSFTDYILIDNILPQKNAATKKGRQSGGISIFCKNKFEKFITIVKKGENHLWIKIKKELFNDLVKDVFICPTYSPR